MDARTIAAPRNQRPTGMTFRLAALDIEQRRTRVAIGVRCPGCGLLYLGDDVAVDPETYLDAELEARARLYVACPDHACAFTVGAGTPPPVRGRAG